MIRHREHPNVLHPDRLLAQPGQPNRFIAANARFAGWLADHVLASLVMFDLALIVPLVAIPAPYGVKLIVGIISSNWIQLWALPALQRTGNSTAAHQKAQSDAQHVALTHIANVSDRVHGLLRTDTPGGLAEVLEAIDRLKPPGQ